MYIYMYIYKCEHTAEGSACSRDHRAVRIEGVQRQHRVLLFWGWLRVLERRGSNFKGFEGFDLKAKAMIWP